MKKMLAFLLLFALLLPAVLVSGEGAPVRITLWHSMSQAAGERMEGYVKQFNETIGKEKGIVVESVFQGAYADAVSKMNSLLANKQYAVLPDVMQMDATGKVSYAAAEIAYPVEQALQDHPEADLSALLSPALVNWQLAGRQLGLPFATSTTVTYYNKTALDALNMAAPRTLQDVAALAPLNKDGITVYAAVPNTPTLANWLGQLGSDLVDQHNGTEGTATALACIDNGALATFLQAWKDLYASGALANTSGSTDEFVAGRQLMMTHSTSSVASLLERIGGAFELGVAPYLKVNADAASGATVSGSCLVMFDQGDARKAAAWEFAQFLTSAPIQADLCVGTGYLPANGQAASSDTWKQWVQQYPQYEVGLTQLMETPDSMRSVTVGPAADFYYGIINDISDMLEEDLSVEETVALMQQDLDGMLAQYLKANP